MKLREMLTGLKTYIVAAIAILAAILAFITGEIDIAGMVAAVVVALQTVFLRSGVKAEADRTMRAMGLRPPPS